MNEPLADTARAAAENAQPNGGEIFGELLHHVRDSHELETPFGTLHLPQFHPVAIWGITIDFSITKHVFFVWLAAFILAAVAIAAAKRNKRSAVPKGLGNMVEAMVVFVRDEVAVPNMGPGGLRYMP